MVNYEMRGSMCSSLVPYVLLLVLLLSLCANEAALGQSNQGSFLFIDFYANLVMHSLLVRQLADYGIYCGQMYSVTYPLQPYSGS